jgi:hypothetical protein
MPNLIDLTGQRFASFTVQRQIVRATHSRPARWLALCDCGAEITARGDYLRDDRTRCPDCSNGRKPSKRCRLGQREYNRRHRATFSHARRRAELAVQTAIYSGALRRQPCEICGRAQADAHHDDYAQPLSIRWLCRSDHKKHHHQFGPGKNAFCEEISA